MSASPTASWTGSDDARQEPATGAHCHRRRKLRHHHHKGDMALAFALHAIEARQLARLTVYGEYLELHPPPVGGGDLRKNLLELRARGRTLAERLRVQLRRTPRLAPGMARAAAGGTRLASGFTGSGVRGKNERLRLRSLEGAKRLHPSDSGPGAGCRGCLPRGTDANEPCPPKR